MKLKKMGKRQVSCVLTDRFGKLFLFCSIFNISETLG